jgi:2-iminobutanoate/2-iminopropanoate deaminase
MNRIVGVAMLLASTSVAALPVTHFPATAAPFAEVGAPPPFSAAVRAGDTLYVAGTTDADPATGKPAPDATTGARVVLDKIKATVEAAGLTMNDLVWVEVFATNLADYRAFNAVYRSYFTGALPTRAFIGAGSLLGGSHFEVMGIAVKAK